MKNGKQNLLSRRTSLNGPWSLRYRRKQASDAARRPSARTAIPARVPGDVHLDLMRAGKIQDPLLGDNAPKCRWIGRQEWWYQRRFRFEPAQGRQELVFEGLCYVADVWLNGTRVGHHENMHRPLRIDVSKHLKRSNTLEVRLLAFSDKALETPHIRASAGYPAVGKEYGYKKHAMRKAAYSFGWNWTQGLPICGIWRDVWLESIPVAKTEDVFVQADPDGSVEVSGICRACVSKKTTGRVRVDISEYDSGKHVTSADTKTMLSPGANPFRLRLFIRNPKLWWPAGLGEPFLYRAVVSLHQEGAPLAEETVRFGIRKVEVWEPRISEDRAGFTFAVNSIPVFIKGANWIPPDIIPPRAGKRRYETLLSQAVECGMNYLRFWGGGIYEGEDFYRLCDEKGIMIWQDMMFGNGELPDFDPAYVAEVEKEVTWAIKHLRNHPSIIMWCGSNETDQCCQQYKARRPGGMYYGERMLHELFPKWLTPLDRTREYRPSSGCLGKHSPPDDSYLNFRHGVCHEYYQDPFNTDEELDEKTPAFVNEWYGGSVPLQSSLNRFLKRSEQKWDSDAFRLHDFSAFLTSRGMGPVIAQHLTDHDMGNLPGIPFKELCDILAEWHAEYMTRCIEHYRRQKWICSGYSYWMFNSAYTSVDKSLTDYYCTPKPAFYAVKRLNRPVLPIVALYRDRLEAHLSNDSLQWHRGTLALAVRTFAGRTVYKESARVALAPNSSERFICVEWNRVGEVDTAGTFVQLTFTSDDGHRRVRNHRFLDKIKRLKLPIARVTIKPVGKSGDRVVLKADSFARRVTVLPSDHSTRPDDNFFDLLPGEAREIRFNRPVPRKRIKVTWSNDRRAGLVLSRFSPDKLCITPGTPLEVSCELFNPGGRPAAQSIRCALPDGFSVVFPKTVVVKPKAATRFAIVIHADPFRAVPGFRRVTFRLGKFRFAQDMLVDKALTISTDGKLQFQNGTHKPLCIDSLTVEWDEKNGDHKSRELGPLSIPPGTFRRRALTPDSRVVPFSVQVRSAGRGLGSHWVGATDAASVWAGLPQTEFRARDLVWFRTANDDWPNLGAEGHGLAVKAGGKDPAISFKGSRKKKALLFLHHNARAFFIDILVRGIDFHAPDSERALDRGTSVELGLSTTPEQMDFECVLALTDKGPGYRIRLKNGRRPKSLAPDPDISLKVFHFPDSRLLTYHVAVARRSLAPRIPDRVRAAFVINENETSHIKVFDGIVGGKSAAAFGVAGLE